jgi:hypothetical protein
MGGNRGKRLLQAFLMQISVMSLLLDCELARGQSPQPPASQTSLRDLTQVSIESLMNMEVTSVSKKEQKLSEVAAAIFVITPEDIARSGATNIPDLLRMVPGSAGAALRRARSGATVRPDLDGHAHAQDGRI